jgi:flagellar biosynthesis GTPase FlhF
MSSLAELPQLVGFFSYSRDDDEDFKGSLSALRDGIQRELRAQLGRNKSNFRLFQDQEAITPGKHWEVELKNAIAQSVFFIPLITPRSVGSKYCQLEFESFLAREQAIGRTDLIFPILYIPVPALQHDAKWRGDPVLSIVGQRQYVDWRSVRHLEVSTPAVREKIADYCRTIAEALNETWVSPEERRIIEETKARQLAEEQRTKAEAKQRAEEEKRRKQAEAEAQQRADRERAEALRRAAEEENRKKAEAEALERAEKERARKEEETKHREEQEQEQAFAAAKRADSISAIDTFLASHPQSRYTGQGLPASCGIGSARR